MSQLEQEQFLGSLINLNREHISQLTPETSELKLTLIAY